MASNTQDSADNKQQFRRVILLAQVEMQEARREYWADRADGRLSPGTANQLHASLMSYYDALRRHREEDNVEEKWAEYDLDGLGTAMLEDVTERVGAPGRGNVTKTVTRPNRLEPKQAVSLSYVLDDLARDLGFAPAVDTPTAQTEITEEDIERVKEWRKQNL